MSGRTLGDRETRSVPIFLDRETRCVLILLDREKVWPDSWRQRDKECLNLVRQRDKDCPNLARKRERSGRLFETETQFARTLGDRDKVWPESLETERKKSVQLETD